jgi:nucleoid-associated protein YgaU
MDVSRNSHRLGVDVYLLVMEPDRTGLGCGARYIVGCSCIHPPGSAFPASTPPRNCAQADSSGRMLEGASRSTASRNSRPPLAPVRQPLIATPRETSEDSPATPQQPAVGSAIVAPEFREYTIKAGDTFERIARRELGSPRLVQAIQRANPLRDPRRIRPGDVIRLPVDPSNIQGKPAGSISDANPELPAPANFAEYVVVRGDTLSSIAQRLLGSSDQARAIYELNRDRLRSMNSIRIGQRLRIPVPADPS